MPDVSQPDPTAPSSVPRLTPRRILDETYRLLNEGWIQGSNACKADGEYVRFDDPRACAFCLQGALFRAGYNLGVLVSNKWDEVWWEAHDALDPDHGPMWDFNDDRQTTREDVLRYVDQVRQLF
jgi:hypothetical protein